MDSDQDLDNIAIQIQSIEQAFVPRQNAPDFLPDDPKARYTSLAAQAKVIIDLEYGSPNPFSSNISKYPHNRTQVSITREAVQGAAKELRRRKSRQAPVQKQEVPQNAAKTNQTKIFC